MISTKCCEITEIFEQTITKTRKVIDSINDLKDEKNFPAEFKKIYVEAWGGGAFYFSYLIVDKLYKEDRLCQKNCFKVYDEMSKNFDKIYNIANQIKIKNE